MGTEIDANWVIAPTDSTLVSQIDDAVMETRANIVTRFANEHSTYLGTTDGASATVDGWHLPGSAKAYCDTTAPTQRPDESTNLSAADEGRLFVRTSSDTSLTDDQANELLFYDGTLGAWTELNYFSDTVKFGAGFIVGDVTVTAAGAQGIMFYDSSYVLPDISGSTDGGYFLPTGVNLSPETDGGCDLGSDTLRWGAVYGDAVYGAVGNDYADALDGLAEGVDIRWGSCYVQTSDGIHISSRYGQRGTLGVATRTASFYADNKKIGSRKVPLAVAGFALAEVDRRYEAGTPLVSAPMGQLTRARWWTRMFHPERVVGVYVRMPGDRWGEHPSDGMAVVKVV